MKHSLLNASPIPVLTSTTTTTTTTTNWVRPSFFRELFFSFWFTLGRFFQTLTNVSEHLPVRGKGLSELNLDASRIFTEFENSLKLDSTIFSSDYVLVLFFSYRIFKEACQKFQVVLLRRERVLSQQFEKKPRSRFYSPTTGSPISGKKKDDRNPTLKMHIRRFFSAHSSQ